MNMSSLFWTARCLCALELMSNGGEVGKAEAHLGECSIETGGESDRRKHL
jgi:hypothetical protein